MEHRAKSMQTAEHQAALATNTHCESVHTAAKGQLGTACGGRWGGGGVFQSNQHSLCVHTAAKGQLGRGAGDGFQHSQLKLSDT